MATSDQNSEYYISLIKRMYGENLEKLSVKDRYSLIALLSLSVSLQTYPIKIYVQEQNLFDKLLNPEVMSSIDFCPVIAAPNVLKFLSESIPAKW